MSGHYMVKMYQIGFQWALIMSGVNLSFVENIDTVWNKPHCRWSKSPFDMKNVRTWYLQLEWKIAKVSSLCFITYMIKYTLNDQIMFEHNFIFLCSPLKDSHKNINKTEVQVVYSNCQKSQSLETV